MRLTRLYYPEVLSCSSTIQLDSNASNHLIRVLRTREGSTVILFNGDGFDYSCKTLDNNAKTTRVCVESKTHTDNESNLFITLIQGLSRQDRMEATIQKSVELGVTKIIPVICQRSNNKLTHDKKIKKIDHWQKVAISACEQSGRSIIPEITHISSLNELHLRLEPLAQKINLNPDAKTSLKDMNHEQQIKEVFIGPEGGLNAEEIDILKQMDFTDIRFGPRILRTETAGPAVISAIQTLWGDL
ncbi:MAG: 16S rRNA (uracil(1498)-N(3))-methyltransferase [Gammaproteobacteria bacterium]|nr:16S rRNA (uracil(1498)-N(3))-methyltransferase [Gammaproteobacteria bacterium]